MKQFIALLIVGVFIGMSAYALTQQETKPMPEKAKQFDTSHLTDKQKYVTLHSGTERAFDNEFWNNKEPGIYVDVINGKPLFSSTDKFDSGSGWPSFTRPINDNNVEDKTDTSHGMVRTEVSSSETGAHLGHVFPDGPQETGGLRYCINSASLRFIHKNDLEKEGYGQYLTLFNE